MTVVLKVIDMTHYRIHTSPILIGPLPVDYSIWHLGLHASSPQHRPHTVQGEFTPPPAITPTENPSNIVETLYCNMTPKCAAAPRTRDYDDASYNVTELLLERYKDSPKDDWERLVNCWGYTDCGDCHRSDGHCGWCPIVGLIRSNDFINLLLNRANSRRRVFPYQWIACLARFLCYRRCGTSSFALKDRRDSSFVLRGWAAKFLRSRF